MTVVTLDSGALMVPADVIGTYQAALADGRDADTVAAAVAVIHAAESFGQGVIGRVLLQVTEPDGDDDSTVLSRSGWEGSRADWAAQNLGKQYSKAHISNLILTAKASQLAGVQVGERAARALRPLVRNEDATTLVEAAMSAATEAAVVAAAAPLAKRIAREAGRSKPSKADTTEALALAGAQAPEPTTAQIEKAVAQVAAQQGIKVGGQKAVGRAPMTPAERFTAALDRTLKAALADGLDYAEVERTVRAVLAALDQAQAVEVEADSLV